MKITSFEKGFAVGLVIVFIISGCTAGFLWLHVKEAPHEKMVLDADEVLLSELGIKFLVKEFVFSEPVLKDYGEYMCVYVDESDLYSIGDGRPVLPVNLSVFEFPFGTEIIDVSYECSTTATINLTKKLSFGSYSPESGMDEDIYDSSDLYPSDWVTYHTGGGLSNDEHKTFLVVRVYPVRYLPLDDQLQFIQNVIVKIKYNEPTRPILEDNDVYDFLIIAPSEFKRPLQPLVEHKNKYNIKTRLVTLEEVYDEAWYGRDKQEQIKYYIKEAIEKWGINYVALVGGIKGQSSSWRLPVRYSHVVPTKEQEFPEQSFISDLYYADIYDSLGGFSSWDSNHNNIFAEWNENNRDEMDLYPDVYLGRLACRNILEVKTMVKKALKYETTTYGKEWFKNLLLIAGDSYDDVGHLNEGELIGEQAIEYMPGFKPVKVYASDGDLTRKRVNNAINKGCGFAFFPGHGAPTAWGTHFPPDGKKWCRFYSTTDMVFLNNKEKLPIVIVGGCNNAQFDISVRKSIEKGVKKNGLRYFSINPLKLGGFWRTGILNTNCWAWCLTSKIGGGSIATIANTGLGTHGRDDADNNTIADYLEVLDGWLELRFLQLYGEENMDILGKNHGETLTGYLHRFLGNDDKMDVKMVQQWELFGDPSLKIGGYEQT